MKNKKIWIILAVIVVVVMMQTGFFKKEGLSYYYGSQEECVVFGRQWGLDRSYPCVAPCVAASTVASCLQSNCGITSTALAHHYYDTIYSCGASYTQGPVGKCWMDCLYGGGSPSYSCSCTSDDIYSKGTCTNDYNLVVEDYCKDANTLYKFECTSGISYYAISCTCVDGECVIGYTDFTSYKNSYLTGGSLSAFISNSNQWIQ